MTWTRNRPEGLVYREADRAWGGYTLFCSVRGKCATLIDELGRIVHRWRHEEGIQNAELLDSGNLLIHTQPPADAGGAEQIGGSAGALVELDPDSKVVWEHRNAWLHHACDRLPDGNTVMITWRRLPEGVTEQVRGGHAHPEDPDRMWGDVVQEVASDGSLVREWRSWEHLSFDEDVRCPLESRKEWTHANSVQVTPSGDWLISFRLTSTVGIVDPRSGAFKWKFRRFLSHQHAATWLPNGHVLIFDNGCHRPRMPCFSQLLEVDPATDEIVWQYQGQPLLAFFSFMGSGADRLPNGNTMVTEGATGRLFEITPAGETVWEYVSPFLGHDPRFGFTPAVFRARRYAPDARPLEGLSLDPRRWADITRRAASGNLTPEDT